MTSNFNQSAGHANHAQRFHPYAAKVYAELQARVPWEVEFLSSVEEVFRSITPLLESDPNFQGQRILERIVEPERVVSFRVAWVDERNVPRVHRGYRIQFNSALGPYKGGTRFHASVNLSSLKLLAFEQTFKNALTGLPMGGGKGGADLNARGLSENEVMSFCQSYMTELYRHMGADIDIPAGDIGVGTREIGYLYGQYKRLTRRFDSAMTGKGLDWGGSRLRAEATGFGLVYFAEEMLRTQKNSLADKVVAISGFGNVAWGAAKKVTEMGGKVVTLSGPDGFIYDPDGLNDEKIAYMLEMRMSGRDEVKMFSDKFDVEFHAGRRPWEVVCDVALPCAIQHELDKSDAETLVKNGCQCVAEGANMPATLDAAAVLQDSGLLYAPGKASNAGGVAISGLEISQNRAGDTWPIERIDEALHTIMSNIHEMCTHSAERCGRPGDYVTGANTAGFLKVAQAMIDQGVV